RPLAADPSAEEAVHRIYRLLAGQGEAARADAVSLNAGLLFYLAGRAATIAAGVVMAARLLGEGQALAVLRRWVSSQNRKPQQGLAILEQLARQGVRGAARARCRPARSCRCRRRSWSPGRPRTGRRGRRADRGD
ncbi:MAG: hypothetical protein R6X14_02085, partial [bacterium]